MTDFYKNNDNLLRDKLTQHEFAQNPKAWENMSALLDQHAIVPKRAIGYWWSIPFVTAAALAGVIGLGMYFTPNSRPPATSSLPIAEQAATEATLLSAPKTSKQFTEVTAPKQELKPTLVEAKQATVATKQALPKEVSTRKKASPKQRAVTTSTNNDQQNPTALAAASSSTPVIKKQAVENLENTVTATTAPIDTKIQGTTRKVKTTRTEIIYQYSTTPLRALQEKRKVMEKQNTIGTFGIGDELNIKKSPLKAAVFGGASAKVYGSTKDFSVMPFAGVSASYRIAKHHGIQTGLQYKSIGNLTQKNPTIQIDNGSGLAISEQSIKRIDLLEIPLVYQFHPHPKYNIQAGVKGAWLMNTETSNPDLNNLSNAEMGISDFDFSLLLGMEYCFNEHWSMGIQYSLGLINLTKEASNMHEEEIQANTGAGYDSQYNISSLDNRGELIVPVSTEHSPNQAIKVPNQLHNNDVQLLLKYTF
jgi:hypothetical protein